MKFTRRKFCSIPIPFLISTVTYSRPGQTAEYDSAFLASAEKEGHVLVYSVTSAENWRPLLHAFHARYPKIKITTLDLPSAPECFERYLAESATNSNTCDFIMTQGREQWLDFCRRGELLEYESAEAAHWPAWSKPFPGMYTPAMAPVVLAWNNMLVPESQRPDSMESFVQLASNHPSWKNRISSFTPLQGIFGYSVNYAFVQKHGEKAWNWFNKLSKLKPRFERSSGPMIEKVASGEYVATWFLASSVLWSRLHDPVRSKIIGWSFIGDGQPIVLTGAGIPKKARNVHAAKLLMDFILSKEGQRALGMGGITPAHTDLEPDKEVPFTFKSISKAVGGENNIIQVEWDPEQTWDFKKFAARWHSTFDKQ